MPDEKSQQPSENNLLISVFSHSIAHVIDSDDSLKHCVTHVASVCFDPLLVSDRDDCLLLSLSVSFSMGELCVCVFYLRKGFPACRLSFCTSFPHPVWGSLFHVYAVSEKT